jgi:K(+)-stimulated pyrophosphate-energized sodium pump
MGMSVVGLAMLGILIILAVARFFLDFTIENFSQNILQVVSGFSLGASSMALFARVGGGIFTKAADVGADLVGKVEAGIPEDDHRNPATIADNVGDNVGDVAGMGADLFESYVGSIVGAMILGAATVAGDVLRFRLAIFPLILAALGVLASLIGIRFVQDSKRKESAESLEYRDFYRRWNFRFVYLPCSLFSPQAERGGGRLRLFSGFYSCGTRNGFRYWFGLVD